MLVAGDDNDARLLSSSYTMSEEVDDVVSAGMEDWEKRNAERERKIDKEHGRLGLRLEGEEREAFEDWRQNTQIVGIQVVGRYHRELDRKLDNEVERMILQVEKLNAWYVARYPWLKDVERVRADDE